MKRTDGQTQPPNYASQLSTISERMMKRSGGGRPDTAQQTASRPLCVFKTRLPIGM
jgi:hypothetical protein